MHGEKPFSLRVGGRCQLDGVIGQASIDGIEEYGVKANEIAVDEEHFDNAKRASLVDD